MFDEDLYRQGTLLFEQKFKEVSRGCPDCDLMDAYHAFLEQTAFDAYFNGLDYGTMDPALAYFAVCEYYPDNIAVSFWHELKENEWI